MYRTTIDFHKRLTRGEIPTPYIIIQTHMGYRAYAEKELTTVFDPAASILDGSWDFDGSVLLGGSSLEVMEKSARVVSFQPFERNLQSLKEDVLGSYQTKMLQHLSIDLDNSDRYFSQLIASEPFITRPIVYYLGFESLPFNEHLKRFSGVITEMNVLPTLTIEADEE